MSEPNTIESLRREFSDLGLQPGMTVMVHSSLGRIGWTVGGAVTVIRALRNVLGAAGTLVMPAESPTVSDPSTWTDARVKAEWHDVIRTHQPVFDPLTTPTTMGAIAEAFRTFPGTLRSSHPLVSVCALGRLAAEITREHALEFCEGKGSPFEKLYALDAQTLLLGVGFNRCSSLHYAESLVPHRRTTISRFPLMRNGERVWVEKPDMAFDNGRHFPAVGEKFMLKGRIRAGRIGNADALLFSTRELVEFAESYFLGALTQ
jgi:aminoglycoside 3-N-acetyltransferase